MKRQRLLEFAVGFAGKADHDVGAEGEFGTGGAQEQRRPCRRSARGGSGGACGAARRRSRTAAAGARGGPGGARRIRAMSAISSSSQSMGSMELRRRRGSAVCSKNASGPDCREVIVVRVPDRSRPQRPRLMPESTSSLPPAATKSVHLRAARPREAGFLTGRASEG